MQNTLTGQDHKEKAVCGLFPLPATPHPRLNSVPVAEACHDFHHIPGRSGRFVCMIRHGPGLPVNIYHPAVFIYENYIQGRWGIGHDK